MTNSNLHPIFKEILDYRWGMQGVSGSSSGEPESNFVCPKCGNTGRCEPRTLSDPDGQECDCGQNTQQKMKTLKLQVGKTYISRKGEEVRIIKNDGKGRYSYQGDNGQWYTKNGKWGYLFNKQPNDLIEEVPEACHTFGLVPEALTAIRYTFDIPNGMKKGTVSQEGNRIVVEMVPEEVETPKPGDVMINDRGSVYIFKAFVDDDTHEHYAWLGENGRLSVECICEPGRPATPEEAQPLWDALKKAGKRWNPETMQVEDVPEIDHIREWVDENIEYRYYTKEVIAEAIEDYLKYKEGEK